MAENALRSARRPILTKIADVADTTLRDDESVRSRHERATAAEDREQMQKSGSARATVDRAIDAQKPSRRQVTRAPKSMVRTSVRSGSR